MDTCLMFDAFPNDPLSFKHLPHWQALLLSFVLSCCIRGDARGRCELPNHSVTVGWSRDEVLFNCRGEHLVRRTTSYCFRVRVCIVCLECVSRIRGTHARAEIIVTLRSEQMSTNESFVLLSSACVAGAIRT